MITVQHWSGFCTGNVVTKWFCLILQRFHASPGDQVLRKCTGRNLYNDPENTLELSSNTNQAHRKQRSWNGLLLKEVSLQILQTEKLYNLCTRRWFLTASVQGYYDRRRRRRRRRCLNRVAKLEWSSLILVLASRNVWHERTTQTFSMDFFEIFFHNSISHSSGTKNIRMIESFWV